MLIFRSFSCFNVHVHTLQLLSISDRYKCLLCDNLFMPGKTLKNHMLGHIADMTILGFRLAKPLKISHVTKSHKSHICLMTQNCKQCFPLRIFRSVCDLIEASVDISRASGILAWFLQFQLSVCDFWEHL